MAPTLQRLANVPRRAASLLTSGADILQDLAVIARGTYKIGREAAKRTAAVAKRVALLDKDVRAVHSEVRALRTEIQDRLLQYNLLLGRLSRHAPEGAGEPKLSGRTLPLTLDEADSREWETVGDGLRPDPEGREWLLLDSCAVCGQAERTIVNQFNKLILMEKAPDDTSAQYDYAICHACGVLHATRRPFGSRYRFLIDNFGEVTAKTGGGREIKNPLLNPYPLSDEDRAHLRKLASKGVFISDHEELRSAEYLDGLLKDRFENSVHVDVIASLVPIRGARVLELRPRTGAISESLRRLFGAEVCGMPIWESQRFLLEEVYGIDSPGLIDYDRFDIPFEGQFDLIVANHMLTHSVRPSEVFATLRQRLKPGGHLYLYNEPDDAEFLSGKQSMFATLNPLHMRAFDHRSLRRALAANGFDVVFQKRRNVNHLCLARMAETRMEPMTESERNTRIKAYRRARDRAALGIREELRPRFSAEWPALVERGVAEGVAEFDASGRLHLVAP